MKGCIIKRGESSYLLKYDIGRDYVTGKRQVRYKTIHGTKKDAQRELRKILNQVDEKSYVEHKKISLGEWMEIWLRDYAEVSVRAKTFERYAELLRLHVHPYIGQIPLQKLTASHVQDLYSKLRKEGKIIRSQGSKKPRGLSERTVLHVHRVLSQLMKEAKRKREVIYNPIEDVRAPRPMSIANSNTETIVHVNALDHEQLKRLFEGLKGQPLFTLVALAVATGMRRSELLGLRWSDINFEKNTLRIIRVVEQTRMNGLQEQQPKNKSSKRQIGFDYNIFQLLQNHRKTQLNEAEKLGVEFSNDYLLFPESPLKTTSFIKPGIVTKRFSDLAKRLGFPKLRFHDLRHTHATFLLDSGVPINAVAQRLGHSSPTITLSVYGHVLKRSEEQAVKMSGNILTVSSST
ncbi:MAG: tyrosine-type recombinase/integrase [Oligoflexia bacterium]|nr:tyrosine-type recombinase/integrase [Oligoflexia bacterium]